MNYLTNIRIEDIKSVFCGLCYDELWNPRNDIEIRLNGNVHARIDAGGDSLHISYTGNKDNWLYFSEMSSVKISDNDINVVMKNGEQYCFNIISRKPVSPLKYISKKQENE